jgi:hypothetical protein
VHICFYDLLHILLPWHTLGPQESMYMTDWVLNIFHPGAFWKLNTFLFICKYILDGGLNRLKTCILYKLMVLINAVNAHILLLNTPLLLLFFAQARACSNSLAMQPPEGAHVHIKHNGCKSQTHYTFFDMDNTPLWRVQDESHIAVTVIWLHYLPKVITLAVTLINRDTRYDILW